MNKFYLLIFIVIITTSVCKNSHSAKLYLFLTPISIYLHHQKVIDFQLKDVFNT
jgi:hypothetical protein